MKSVSYSSEGIVKQSLNAFIVSVSFINVLISISFGNLSYFSENAKTFLTIFWLEKSVSKISTLRNGNIFSRNSVSLNKSLIIIRSYTAGFIVLHKKLYKQI